MAGDETKNENQKQQTGPGGKDGGQNGGKNDEPQRQSTGESLAQAVLGLSSLYSAAAKDGGDGAPGVSPQVTDAVTQALLLILGSGPSIAAFDGLLSVQQANGIMYHNAVAHQQKTNLLGMAMTAKCVRYMMDPHASDDIDSGVLGEELN